MKIVTTAVTLLILAGGLLAQQTTAKPATSSSANSSTASTQKKAAPAPLTTEKEKASYAIGASVGRSLEHDGVDIDPAVLMRGLKDGMHGKLEMTDKEIVDTINTVRKEAREREEAKMKAQAEKNKAAGEAFLAANKTKEGVVTLPSGLQYKVLKQGDGPKPAASDTVECRYRGTLVDGTEFDNSEKHGGTATFPVSGVIKGWTEILQLMPVGSKYQVFVPSDLAYGPQARSAEIGPNSTLIFDIELVSIKPKPEATAPEKPATPGEPTKPVQHE